MTFGMKSVMLVAYVSVGDSAHIDIFSGSVGGGGGTVTVSAAGTATIYVGVLDRSLDASPGGTIDLMGGSVTGDLVAGGGGTTIVHGTDFNMPLGPCAANLGTSDGDVGG